MPPGSGPCRVTCSYKSRYVLCRLFCAAMENVLKGRCVSLSQSYSIDMHCTDNIMIKMTARKCRYFVVTRLPMLDTPFLF